MDSIGGFAESLINDELKDIKAGKVAPPSTDAAVPQGAPAGKDISNIEVPDEFMKSILGESYKAPEPVEEVETPQEPEVIEPEVVEEETVTSNLLTEDSAQELITLLSEVKAMLSEMTTCGMLGTNMAGPAMGEKPKKKKKSDRKDVFKAALRKRVGK